MDADVDAAADADVDADMDADVDVDGAVFAVVVVNAFVDVGVAESAGATTTPALSARAAQNAAPPPTAPASANAAITFGTSAPTFAIAGCAPERKPSPAFGAIDALSAIRTSMAPSNRARSLASSDCAAR
jgi:hypothetical protein